MKNILIDLIGLIGAGSLCYGIYLQFGLPMTLIVSGGLLLLYALCSARSRR